MERQVPLGEPVGQNQSKTKEVKMRDRITSLIVNLPTRHETQSF